jgi:hypothetical protein
MDDLSQEEGLWCELHGQDVALAAFRLRVLADPTIGPWSWHVDSRGLWKREAVIGELDFIADGKLLPGEERYERAMGAWQSGHPASYVAACREAFRWS